ncbi:hypothetical protein BHE74_00026863 [Ensete ventricosum]|nr:hypothetical protein BHE74_00026863 [Ensete ventricosum]
MCTARYVRYIPIRQDAGTQTVRYRAVPPKIDRWRSIEREKGRKKKKKKKKRREKIPIARTRTSPVRRRRPWVPSARAGRGCSFSRAGRKIEATPVSQTLFTPRVRIFGGYDIEKEEEKLYLASAPSLLQATFLPVRGEGSRRHIKVFEVLSPQCLPILILLSRLVVTSKDVRITPAFDW